ncbi:C40 family peptidase [Sphingobacterium pedocola]|uniref:Glycoside hydrolase n=1 Tax=Sphingobacterium pedocola TaxID=2082722 RepID=A0ABR9T2Y4_9SPHI|nr:NlpC/P60 family protein [Sphingobacterium pedocola]MBE8719244.1 glycoside hydrolase [Sphingobacterium pedocola]
MGRNRIQQIKFIAAAVAFCIFVASCGAKKKGYSYGKPPADRSTVAPSKDTRRSGNTLSHYADVLGVSTKDMNNSLYSFIDNWMGIPHRLGGLTKDGVDCSAFVGMIYKEVYSKNLPRTSRDMAAIIKRKYDDQLREGDLVFFSFGGKNIDHVGIYLHNGKFVHVSTQKGVMISNLKDAWYYKYFTRCGTPNI